LNILNTQNERFERAENLPTTQAVKTRLYRTISRTPYQTTSNGVWSGHRESRSSTHADADPFVLLVNVDIMATVSIQCLPLCAGVERRCWSVTRLEHVMRCSQQPAHCSSSRGVSLRASSLVTQTGTMTQMPRSVSLCVCHFSVLCQNVRNLTVSFCFKGGTDQTF